MSRRAAAGRVVTMTMIWRTTLGAVSAAAIVSLGVATPAIATPAPAATSSTTNELSLPKPTGPFPVGRDTLHLTDPARTDPWSPQSGPRQLMTDLYYPAVPGTGTPASYLNIAEATALLAYAGLLGTLTPSTFAGTRTWTRANARPRPGRYPLVVLSPGFTVPRYTLTDLAEDLSSRGFVVATVDHAYESVATRFPGGVLPCVACDEVDAGTISHAQVATSRAKDVSFLLTELTGPHPAWRHAGTIDPARIGMAGHSIGGDATLATMAADRRVRAGANLDSPITPPVPATGLGHRPVLLVAAADPSTPELVPSWIAGWPNLDGWKRWLTVAGADHYSFTDLDCLVNESGALSIPNAPRSITITAAYVGAFFRRQLNGVPQPLLNGPSAAFPEVTFTHP
jgi:dienelactone hydrolase